MTAVTELRCALCGALFRSPAEAETAHLRYGPEYVCATGYECAARANRARDRRPGLAVVQPIGTVDDDDKASERVQVMLRPSEREVLDVAAKRAGVSLSAYLRRAGLREAAE